MPRPQSTMGARASAAHPSESELAWTSKPIKTASACSKSCSTSATPARVPAAATVARATIEHILTAAQKHRVLVQQPALAVAIASGAATETFPRADLCAPPRAASRTTGDFPFPREYRGVYLERRRESGFQLYNSLGIARGDKAGYAKQALENFNFFGAPHVAIIHTDEALGVYGAIDCGGYVTQLHAGGAGARARHHPAGGAGASIPAWSAGISACDDRRVVCGISFGYADRAHKANSYRTSRASVADTVTFVDE